MENDLMIYGVYKGQRVGKYICSKYVDITDCNFEKYKIVTPKVDGNGAFGAALTKPDHLRGLSRTIPSFLMAYGDNNVTLETFDTLIPDNVFKEVTSITLDEFRFLRDGGS